MAKDTMIGVDLAKNSFQVHGATMGGHVQFRRKLSRAQFLSFMAAQAPAIVVTPKRAASAVPTSALSWIAARIFGVVVACLCREISMLVLHPEPRAGSILP